MNPQITRYQAEADSITRNPMTVQSRARLQFLLNSLSVMKSEFQSPEARSNGSDEQRKESLRFRKLLLEARTYTPLSTSADSQLIAQGFEATVKNLMIADGPLFAGSPLLTNFYAKTMAPSRTVVADDTLSSGFVLVENAGPGADEAEVSGLSSVLFSKKFFSTGIILVSAELAQDISTWTTIESLLARTTAARLSRIQNATWLAALKTALALNSSATVAGNGTGMIVGSDIPNLVSKISQAYRPNSAFVMSPNIQRALSLIVDSAGHYVYRHILDPQPTLQNYPVHVIAAAATNDILFGSFDFAMAKSMPLEVKTLSERFILDGYLGIVAGQRADFQWSVSTTSDSPVKYLTIT